MRYIFLFSLVVLTACGKNEFNLDFKLAKDVTENYNVTYYAHSIKGGATVQAVASVREGICELKGVTNLPTVVYITSRKSKLPLIVYVEKGNDIKISGNNNEPLTWVVKGNEINDSLTLWRTDNSEILSQCIPDSVNQSVARFVEDNPSSCISTILMLGYFSRFSDERKYIELMSSLRGDARNPDILQMMARTDQLYHSYSFPARLESLIMRSLNKEGDTLKIDGKNPLFLIFWETGYSQKKDLIDSIKKLEKAFPDSSRLIADICIDIDSLAWKNAIKKDSLYKDMKRFWAPLGLNDSKIMKLKVKSLPYFIVFNKEGVQSYRGENLEEAMIDYKKLFNSKDSL